MSWFKTPEQLQEAYIENTKQQLTSAVQNHLDSTAKEKGYDSIISLCTYATSTNTKFKAEGQAGVEWRDAVWDTCYQALVDFEAGNRGVPTTEELISELPTITWTTQV